MNIKTKRNRKSKINYCCIRCAYQTKIKTHMQNHFYNLKKTCQAIENNIELTEEIKQEILNNRIYRIPKETKKPNIINNYINNYNQLNNFIGSMDTMDKIHKFNNYNDCELIEIGDQLTDKFNNLNQRQKNNRNYNMDSLLDLLDDISKVTDKDKFQDFNILYDSTLNKLRLYDSGSWADYLLDNGLKEIVSLLQTCYLGNYEIFLLQNIYNLDTNVRMQQLYRERLNQYYKFIGLFDLPLYISKYNNEIQHILNSEKYDTEEVNNIDQFVEIEIDAYKKVKDDLTLREVKKIKKDITDIIKSNTKENLKDLNKKIMNLIKVDEKFKETIIN